MNHLPIIVTLILLAILTVIAVVQYRKGVTYTLTNDREKAFNIVILFLVIEVFAAKHAFGFGVSISGLIVPQYMHMISSVMPLVLGIISAFLSGLATILICQLWQNKPSKNKQWPVFSNRA